MNPFLPVMVCCLAGCSASAWGQTFTTRFAGAEDPLSEGGRWVHRGLDWATFRKAGGIAFGTQSGTNSGAYKYNDASPSISMAWKKPAPRIILSRRAIPGSAIFWNATTVRAWGPVPISVLAASPREVLWPPIAQARLEMPGGMRGLAGSSCAGTAPR